MKGGGGLECSFIMASDILETEKATEPSREKGEWN